VRCDSGLEWNSIVRPDSVWERCACVKMPKKDSVCGIRIGNEAMQDRKSMCNSQKEIE